MRILIYTHTFAPNIGGVETLVMSLATGLVGAAGDGGLAGQDVTVATATPRGEFDDKSLSFRVLRQPTLPQLVHSVRAADVVHLAGPAFLPLLAALLLRKPVVVEHHGFQAICPNGQLLYEPTQKPCPGHFMARHHLECWRCNTKEGSFKSLKMVLQTFPRRWLCKNVGTNVTPTDWLATVLQLPRMTTIYHGILANGKRAGPLAQTFPPAFGFVGRLVSTKGVHILLQATQQLASRGCEFQLKIIGDGPERTVLEAQTRALGLVDRVQFLGHLSKEKVDDLLTGFDAIVMPSLGGEVFGMVAIESMFWGKPVIVSDLGALVEVTGAGGMAFASGNSNALADCMERVLKSPDAAVLQGQDAQKRASSHFTEDRMISEHLAVFQRVVAAGKTAC